MRVALVDRDTSRGLGQVAAAAHSLDGAYLSEDPCKPSSQRPTHQRRSGRYARVHGRCSGGFAEVAGPKVGSLLDELSAMVHQADACNRFAGRGRRVCRAVRRPWQPSIIEGLITGISNGPHRGLQQNRQNTYDGSPSGSGTQQTKTPVRLACIRASAPGVNLV